MIRVKDYEHVLLDLGREYFVESVELVPNLVESCREAGVDLAEPAQPMAVVAVDGDTLKLIAKAEVEEDQLDGVLKALGVRWARKDTATDVSGRFDSVKKRLGFCFLKDYARTVPNVGGDELQEDEWAVREMERFGFFLE